MTRSQAHAVIISAWIEEAKAIQLDKYRNAATAQTTGVA